MRSIGGEPGGGPWAAESGAGSGAVDVARGFPYKKCMRPALVLGVVVYLLASPPAGAAEWVEFEDGRVMRVASVAHEDGVAVLHLEGGGAVSVPLASIADRQHIAPEPAAPADPAGRAAGDPAADPEWAELAGEFAALLAEAAGRHGVEPALLMAMARAESAFDPFAVSPKGACGLLQLMPATAERFGVTDVFDARQNVDGGARYMRWLLDRYDGDTELALAAYNAGENAVDRYRGVPPYSETRTYVARVLGWAGDAATGSAE